MPQFQIAAHTVQVFKITGIEPLVRAGTMLGPSSGVMLVREDGVKQIWLMEKNQPLPAAGDFWIHDEVLNLDFVVPAARFLSCLKRRRDDDS